MELKGIGPTIAAKLFRSLVGKKQMDNKSTKVVSANTNNSHSTSTGLSAAMTIPRPQIRRTNKKSAGSLISAKLKTEPETSAKQRAYEEAKREAETLTMPIKPKWKVILVVDAREHKSQKVISRCQQVGIPCEERTLPIGDMAWIAQCTTEGSPTKVIEVMCGTIMERKEISDFSASLFGTRYNEQRLRLKNSGLPQVLFLVEGDLNKSSNCSPEALHTAMMETRVRLGFSVVQTKHLEDTVRLLKGLHRRIVQRTFPKAFSSLENDDPLPNFASPNEAIMRYGKRAGRRQRRPTSLLELYFDSNPVPPFGASRFITYRELKAKVERDREAGQRTVGALYLAMLKQVPSFSHKKCHAIARQYPTLNALMSAYANCTSDDPSLMVRDVPCEFQKIGPKSSQELYTACCTDRNGNLPRKRSNTNSSTGRTTSAKRVKNNLKNPPEPPKSISLDKMPDARLDSSISRLASLSHSASMAATCVDLTSPTSAKPGVASKATCESSASEDSTHLSTSRLYERQLQTPDSSSSSSCSEDHGSSAVYRERGTRSRGHCNLAHSDFARPAFPTALCPKGHLARRPSSLDHPCSDSSESSTNNSTDAEEDAMLARLATKDISKCEAGKMFGRKSQSETQKCPSPSIVILDDSDGDSCSYDTLKDSYKDEPRARVELSHSIAFASKPPRCFVSNSSSSSDDCYNNFPGVSSREYSSKGMLKGRVAGGDGQLQLDQDISPQSRKDHNRKAHDEASTKEKYASRARVLSPPQDIEVIEID